MKKRNIAGIAVIVTIFGIMAGMIYSMMNWEIMHINFDKLN